MAKAPLGFLPEIWSKTASQVTSQSQQAPGTRLFKPYSRCPLLGAISTGRNHVVSYNAENDSLEIFEKIFSSLFDGITFIHVAVGRIIERRELMNFAV